MSQGQDRWLIALDLDGTVVDEEGKVSPEVLGEVQRVRDLGHEVMIATGRPVMGAIPVYKALGLVSNHAVCSNGAITVEFPSGRPDEYHILSQLTFDPSPVLELVAPALPLARYAVEDGVEGYRFDRPFPAGTFGAKTSMVSFDELKSHPVTRVIVVSPGHDIEDFFQVVERIGLHQVSYSVGWSAWLDIAPMGVNKSTGLEIVRKTLDIDSSRVMVIGDGYNDVEMLEWAVAGGGVGAAMGHASDRLKSVANRVVAPFDGHGVAEALSWIS